MERTNELWQGHVTAIEREGNAVTQRARTGDGAAAAATAAKEQRERRLPGHAAGGQIHRRPAAVVLRARTRATAWRCRASPLRAG